MHDVCMNPVIHDVLVCTTPTHTYILTHERATCVLLKHIHTSQFVRVYLATGGDGVQKPKVVNVNKCTKRSTPNSK